MPTTRQPTTMGAIAPCEIAFIDAGTGVDAEDCDEHVEAESSISCRAGSGYGPPKHGYRVRTC